MGRGRRHRRCRLGIGSLCTRIDDLNDEQLMRKLAMLTEMARPLSRKTYSESSTSPAPESNSNADAVIA